ncbi:MAG: AAA family ATPase [Bacteroidales bacterium]|nr:AAA family ATPase [Candidatus Liminaster caballi]
MRQHLNIQEHLLKLEYEFEKKEYEEMSRQAGIQRRIRQGKCLYPISGGRTFYNALNQLVIEVFNDMEGDQPDREAEFEPGRPVAFFRTEDDHERPIFFTWSCMVSRVDGQRLLITIPNTQAAETIRQYARTSHLGVQLSFDATSHHVMREAIHKVSTTDNPRLQHLRNVLIGSEQPSFRTEQPLPFPWLNQSQQKAVMKVICAREVAIVHGPPGTGKTTTLVEAIGETLRRETQVLVCAQSNAAVDWIAEQLLARGISVLRVGNPMRVSDSLLDATYERRYESHPDYTELWAIRKAEREAIAKLSSRNASATERRAAGSQLGKLRNRRTELEIRINEDLFAQSRVIACTLIGTASRVLERKHFSTLFIDEAAQAFEAACWAAIIKADRVILAGDHCQLPPTVKCREAEMQGLSHTLMQKVAKEKPTCVELLTVQYRMHQDIMRFSSDWFYQGRLTAAPEVALRTVFPLDTPMVWIDTSKLGFEEQLNPLSQSRLNTSEGLLLVKTLRDYIRQLGIDRMLRERIDFGIISPYKSQVQLLRKLVRQSSFLQPIRHQITVNTVDGFQGQERDVILISMVRGNDEGRIGFLNDLRRMNVAITRARMKLIVLGDASTLSHHSFYHRLVEHITEHGELRVEQPDDAAGHNA